MQKAFDQQCKPRSELRSQISQKCLTVTKLAAGNGVRVQTDLPHLVSLGGGRLSTAVTLLPVPPGKTIVGSMDSTVAVDIVIRGCGVDPVHCYLMNENDVVTLYPLSNLTSVDSIKVSSPTRLTQGSMLCFGRSNYFRFNHPTEANRIKAEFPVILESSGPVNDMGNGFITETIDSVDGEASQHLYDNVRALQLSRRSRRDVYLENKSEHCHEQPRIFSDNRNKEFEGNENQCYSLRRYYGQPSDASNSNQRTNSNSQSLVCLTGDRSHFNYCERFPDVSRYPAQNFAVQLDANTDDFRGATIPTSISNSRAALRHSLNASELYGRPTSQGSYSDYCSGYDNIVELKKSLKISQEAGNNCQLSQFQMDERSFPQFTSQVVHCREPTTTAHGVDAEASKAFYREEILLPSIRVSQTDAGPFNDEAMCHTSSQNSTSSSSVNDRDTDSTSTLGERHTELVLENLSIIGSSPVSDRLESPSFVEISSAEQFDFNQVSEHNDNSNPSLKLPVTFETNVKEEKQATSKEEAVENKKPISKKKTGPPTREKPPLSKQNKIKTEENKKNKITPESKVESNNSKGSFFRSLLTRSRSPSPSRGSKRSESPVISRGKEVAKRLSEPLKTSFRKTSIDNTKAQIASNEACISNAISDIENLSNIGQREDKSTWQQAEDDTGPCLAPLAETKPVVAHSDAEVQQAENKKEAEEEIRLKLSTCDSLSMNMNGDKLLKENAENPSKVTTTSLQCRNNKDSFTRPTPTINQPEKPIIENNRQSFQSIRLFMGDTSPSNSTASPIADQNPWRVNLKDLNITPNLENFKGEKLFSKDTITTNVMFPSLDISSGHLAENSKRSRVSQVRCRTSVDKVSPLYDCVYDESNASKDDEIIKDNQIADFTPQTAAHQPEHCQTQNESALPLDKKWNEIQLDIDAVEELLNDEANFSENVSWPEKGNSVQYERQNSMEKTKKTSLHRDRDRQQMNVLEALHNRHLLTVNAESRLNKLLAENSDAVDDCLNPEAVLACSRGSRKAGKSVKFKDEVDQSLQRNSDEPISDDSPELSYLDGISSIESPAISSVHQNPIAQDANATFSRDCDEQMPDGNSRLILTKTSSLPMYCKTIPERQTSSASNVLRLSDYRPEDSSDSEPLYSESQKELKALYECTKAQRIVEEESAKTELQRLEAIQKLWENFDADRSIAGMTDVVGDGSVSRAQRLDASACRKLVPASQAMENWSSSLPGVDRAAVLPQLSHQDSGQEGTEDRAVTLLTRRQSVMRGIARLKEQISDVALQQKDLIRQLTRQHNHQSQAGNNQPLWSNTSLQRELLYADKIRQLVKERSQLESECRQSNAELVAIDEALQAMATLHTVQSPSTTNKSVSDAARSFNKERFNSMDTRRFSLRKNDDSGDISLNLSDSQHQTKKENLLRSNSANGASSGVVEFEQSRQAALTSAQVDKLMLAKRQVT